MTFNEFQEQCLKALKGFEPLVIKFSEKEHRRQGMDSQVGAWELYIQSGGGGVLEYQHDTNECYVDCGGCSYFSNLEDSLSHVVKKGKFNA